MASENHSEEEGSLVNVDGLKLFTKSWKPKGEIRSFIFICHGFGEHCSRYQWLAETLTEQGFLVFAHDHVGHGNSHGERAQISNFDIYVRDVFHHVDKVTANNSGLPIFLFGHSMGGAISVLAAMQRPEFFTGIVLSAPAIMANPETATACKVFFGKIAACLCPSVQVVPPIDPKVLSHDSAQVMAYKNDPLIWHRGMKAGWASQMLNTMSKITDQMHTFEWPFIVLQGDADELTMCEGAIRLEEKAKSNDKTIKIYRGYYHELLNEVRRDAEVVMKDIVQWISARMPSTHEQVKLAI